MDAPQPHWQSRSAHEQFSLVQPQEQVSQPQPQVFFFVVFVVSVIVSSPFV
ncbi:MAG: hypothetical protein ABI759_26260 [Candidatus Solibacter sp.]